MGYWAAVVDDDKLNLKAAEKILSSHENKVSCFSSAEEMLEFIKSDIPDIILLDLHMENMDGFEALRHLKGNDSTKEIPVIVLTADDDSETETKALSVGAIDFVKKPFIPSVLLMRVRNTIELMRLQTDLKKEVQRMTNEIIAEHKKNERLSMQIVQTLAGTIDAKDSYTKGHSSRVAFYTREIAKRYGYSEKAQDEIYMMGLLHDVGKIGIPDTVLRKITRLNDDEYALIKTHPMTGFEILRNISEMPKLAIGARWHHERYDGHGYPDKLSGKDIPEEARIIAVADAYDAMSSRRSYHEIFSQDFIIGELIKGKGTQFDPAFADIMLTIIKEDKDYSMKETFSSEPEAEKQIFNEENNDKEKVFLTMLEAFGFNPALGMRYCMNDIGFYSEMLEEFAQNSDERINKLNSFLANNDIDNYRIVVHSIKSTSRSIGCEELSDRAKNLEDAAKNNDITYIINNHEKFLELFYNAINAMNTALKFYNDTK